MLHVSNRLLIGIAMALWALPANAQTPSSRTLQLVVPFAPGAANDNLVRILGAEIGESFGRVVIDEHPGVEIDVWQGILVPAGTPPAITERLNAEFNHILRLPRVHEKLFPQGIDAVGGTPADFGARLKGDIDMYRSLVKPVNLKVK